MPGAAKFSLVKSADAAKWRAIYEALAPLSDHLKNMRIKRMTLTDAEGNTAIFQVIAGSVGVSDSAPGGGLPAGSTFREFTYCDSGSPVTKWWPTWDTDPTA